jgi:hypothetical protein
MFSPKLDRREVLKGVGLAALGGGAAAALAPATALADDSGEGGPVGSWNITIVDLGANPGKSEGVAIFAPGGGFTTSDSGSPFTGLGVWASKGEHKFAITFLNFLFDFTPELKFAGTAKIRAEGTVRGDTQSGTYKVDGVDPKGNTFSSHGTFTGKRMRVEPV